MRFNSRAALLIGALSLAACDSMPSKIVFEGTVSPELDVEGQVFFGASRHIWFCQKYLLQNPKQKEWHRDARSSRTKHGYKLVFELDSAPFGGICDWRFETILLEAKRHRDPLVHFDIAFLSNLDTVASHLRDEQKRLQPGMTVRCSQRGNDPTRIHCDSLDRMIDPMHGETHFKLNVKYEEGHEPTNE